MYNIKCKFEVPENLDISILSSSYLLEILLFIYFIVIIYSINDAFFIFLLFLHLYYGENNQTCAIYVKTFAYFYKVCMQILFIPQIGNYDITYRGHFRFH